MAASNYSTAPFKWRAPITDDGLEQDAGESVLDYGGRFMGNTFLDGAAPRDEQHGEAVGRTLGMQQRIMQLEGALNTAPVGLATLDLAFRYTNVNQVFARLYGKTVDEFVGRTVEEALPLWAPQILKHLANALGADKIVECEIDLTSPITGEPVVYLRTCQPVRALGGRIIGLSVGVIDITERKRVGVRLRESEDNYRHAIELNPHIPWTCGPDGEVFEISPRWTGFTGQKSGRITLADWAQAPHPDDVPGVALAWEKCKESGEPLDVEYRVRCADGKMRWIRARAFARKNGEGTILRWYGMNEDIDERKQMDAALREETRRLEQATEQLAKLVREDHLTGLANRRHFDVTLEREVHVASRSGFPMGLVMMDVDRFKSYNDTYGHVAGDECLRRIGASLRQVVRQPVDLVARYGGEEFAIVLPNTTEEQATEIACRAIQEVRGLGITHNTSPSLRVTLSAGIAMLGITDAQASAGGVCSDLVQMADLALYAAKKAGRDRVIAGRSLALLASSLGGGVGVAGGPAADKAGVQKKELR